MFLLPAACSNVKFSPGVLDLMAFAEHEDLAHIVDVRQWSAVQHLNAGCGQVRARARAASGAWGPAIGLLGLYCSTRCVAWSCVCVCVCMCVYVCVCVCVCVCACVCVRV